MLVFIKNFLPLIFIRRVNHIRISIAFDHFVFFKNHLIFVCFKVDIFLFEQFFYLLITLKGIRFIIVVGIYRVNIVVLNELFPYGFGLTVK